MALGNDWYSQNSQRSYPLSDSATGTTDDGQNLPPDILVDCRIMFPASVGKLVYLGGVTVSAKLVSVTFLAAEAADSDPTPLAAVTVIKPVVFGQAHAVKGMVPGVAGFVVFGQTDHLFAGRFSTMAQSRLLPCCAQPYADWPVTGLRKQGRVTSLTNIVKLLVTSDLEVTNELVTIDGIERTAFVFRLSATTGRNVLADYIGPCDRRPESGTCATPAIEAIGDAVPDCDGNIDIQFTNLSVAPYANCGPGMVVFADLGLTDVCAARSPARFRGTNPCDAVLSSLSSASVVSSSQSSDSVVVSSDSLVCAELPYCENFDSGTGQFRTVTGGFVITAEDSPSEPCPGYSSLSSVDSSESSESGTFSSESCSLWSVSVGEIDEIAVLSLFSESCTSAWSLGETLVATCYARNTGPGASTINNMSRATGAPNNSFATVQLSSGNPVATGYLQNFNVSGIPDNAEILSIVAKQLTHASSGFVTAIAQVDLIVDNVLASDTSPSTIFTTTPVYDYPTQDLLPMLQLGGLTAVTKAMLATAQYRIVLARELASSATAIVSLDSVYLEIEYNADPCVDVPYTETVVTQVPVYSHASECWSTEYTGVRVTDFTRTVNYTQIANRSYTSTSSQLRNIATWDACAYTDSRSKVIETDVMLHGDFTQRNGGLLLNYHLVNPLTNPQYEYFAVVLDRQLGRVRVLKGVASTLTLVHEVTGAANFVLEHWYRLRVTVAEIDTTSTALLVEVSGITNPAWPAISFSLSVNGYMPADGLHGVFTDRARASFAYFAIEELV